LAESAIRKGIEQLRSAIADLRGELALGIRWRSWYDDACSLLAQHYGVDSTELQDFLKIRFEIQGAALQAEDKLQAAVREVFPAYVGPLSVSQDHYYQERLSEADEYLLTLLQSL